MLGENGGLVGRGDAGLDSGDVVVPFQVRIGCGEMGLHVIWWGKWCCVWR